MPEDHGHQHHLCRSIAVRLPLHCGSPPFSVMSVARSLERRRIIKGTLKVPTAGHCFSTKSVICQSKTKSNSFAFWRMVSSCRSAQR
ncbi:hypothetical protein GBAR_LOCUS20043 [Geodia barretti]|uniref:Uncharacterized protein n=1 Tax=Geodia barretti TaxID=519541 RepID=A0AA35X2S9_GEOBA|nr:hypothetical protein GBAR_LOCUS20043 [Geodia barretti]